MMKRVFLKMITLMLLLGSCSTKNSEIEQNNSEIYVRTHKVTLKENIDYRRFIGVVEENMTASISFPLNGNINKMYVSEGIYVQKGQLLAELNDYNLKNLHNATLATLKQAEDAMKRIQMLYDNNSLPEIQYIEMKTNLETARAAEAIAKKNLEESKLYAPFNGVIGKVNGEIGENVLPNQSVLKLLKIDKVNVKIAVPEKEINNINVGQKVSLQVSAISGKSFTGKVSKKGIVADPISHTYPLHISVDNSNNTLLPGMISDVSILDSEKEDAVIIPNRCLLKDGNGNMYVWKVIDNHAKKQIVKTGLQMIVGVEIIDGLKVNDVVVVDGYQKISNGLKVTVI